MFTKSELLVVAHACALPATVLAATLCFSPVLESIWKPLPLALLAVAWIISLAACIRQSFLAEERIDGTVGTVFSAFMVWLICQIVLFFVAVIVSFATTGLEGIQ